MQIEVLPLRDPDADRQQAAAVPGIDRLPAAATASLVLEDGRVFPGRTANPQAAVGGEAVFTTATSGYPEAMTDPSFRGQLLVFTYPEIGIYGVDLSALESGGVYASAIIVHRACRTPSLQGRRIPFLEAATRAGRGVLEGVDTRALTRHLRNHGTLRGAIVPGVPSPELAKQFALAAAPPAPAPCVVGPTTGPEDDAADSAAADAASAPRVAVIDFGLKQGILVSLAARGARPYRVDPEETSPAALLRQAPDGVLLSNGPGDPGLLDREVAYVKALVGKIPLMGVCLGHQILGRALGGATEKLPFGHRGVNQPVRDLLRDRTCITSQNHGYALTRESLEAIDGIRVTHVHAGDGSVEGFDDPARRLRAVQFHPEARPGPVDAGYLFDDFLDSLRAERTRS